MALIECRFPIGRVNSTKFISFHPIVFPRIGDLRVIDSYRPPASSDNDDDVGVYQVKKSWAKESL